MSLVLIVVEFFAMFFFNLNSSKYYQFHPQASSYSLQLVLSSPVLQKCAPS